MNKKITITYLAKNDLIITQKSLLTISSQNKNIKKKKLRIQKQKKKKNEL